MDFFTTKTDYNYSPFLKIINRGLARYEEKQFELETETYYLVFTILQNFKIDEERRMSVVLRYKNIYNGSYFLEKREFPIDNIAGVDSDNFLSLEFKTSQAVIYRSGINNDEFEFFKKGTKLSLYPVSIDKINKEKEILRRSISKFSIYSLKS